LTNILVFPTDRYPAFSGCHILRFLRQQLPRQGHLSRDLVVISFSAGVVGAIAAAWMWQQTGGQIQAFIALDGWGVPLLGHFPIYRLSHDYWTHWTSALLGSGSESFFADPPVSHLDLWRSPQTVTGVNVQMTAEGQEVRSPTTAIAFLGKCLHQAQIVGA
jgi:hypothetical protein